MDNKINETKHNYLEKQLLNNKENLIFNLKTIIDESITDIEFAFEITIDNCRLDCLLITNTGLLTICEIKSKTNTTDVRHGISQLIHYKEKLKTYPYFELLELLKKHSDDLEQFINNNNVTTNALEENYNKINDYYTIFISEFINNKNLNNYKELTNHISNSIILLLNNNNIIIYQFVVKLININGRPFEYELKKFGKDLLTRFKKDILDENNYNFKKFLSKNTLQNNLILDNTEHIKNKLDNNSTEIKTESTVSTDYNKPTDIFCDKIEKLRIKLRIKLINEYKRNTPISIRDFTKLISANDTFPSWNRIYKYFNTSSIKKIFMDGGFNIDINAFKKFNIETREKKKLDILKKINEIYNANNTISEVILKENNVSPSTIKYYFDSIYDAYKLANVKPEQKSHKRLTKIEVISIFNELIPEFKKNNIPFTVKQLEDHGLPFYFVQKFFGSLKNSLSFFNIYDLSPIK